MMKKIVSLNSRIILFKRLRIFPLQMNIHTYTSLMEFVSYKKNRTNLPVHSINQIAQVFQTSRSHLTILGDRWVTGSKFHIKDPRITRRKRAKFGPWHDLDSGIRAPLF
jgi:hypothetical protein